ncbi:MAG: NTP transferase domain-containing protein, partial [Flavobacteriales bacterium]
MDKRHGQISKRDLGHFGRREMALYGTTCEDVQRMAQDLSKHLVPLRIAFVDADHNAKVAEHAYDRWQLDSEGGAIHHQQSPLDRYPTQAALFGYDLILVNGNHHAARQQIVVCNEEKSNSLRKRSKELTHVAAIVLNDDGKLTDTVRELLPNADQLPHFHPQRLDELAAWMAHEIVQTPELHALILTGGKSSRMGRDKALITYHSQPQFLHLTELLKSLDIRPFISCQPQQVSFFEDHGLDVIPDRISDFGPMGGILSAMMQYPEHAWLILACDVPGVDAQVLNELMKSRNPTSMATAFAGSLQGFPEPLIAIWEPK